MHRDSPCEPEWYLRDGGLHLATLFDRPLCVIGDDFFSVRELDDREPLMPSDDMTDRAIRVSRFEIILHEHDACANFEDERFWCETSFFQGFDEWS
jgi:hypothetical protein